MEKLILVSMILATVGLPAVAAADPDPRRGARRLLVALAAFTVLYVLLVARVYARFFVPEWFPL